MAENQELYWLIYSLIMQIDQMKKPRERLVNMSRNTGQGESASNKVDFPKKHNPWIVK